MKLSDRNNVYYYNDGSPSEKKSADETENAPAEQEPEKVSERAEKSDKSDKTEKGGTKSSSVVKIILVSLLSAVLLGSVVYSFDRRNTVYNQVASKTNELSHAEAENIRLQSELESRMTARNVEDYAENVLGLQKIHSSQIKYIKIQTTDVVNIPEQNQGIVGKVKGFFKKCVEYFRG